jgi:hypothetical protein
MTDLKELNSVDLKSLPFPARQTANFPSYWNYKSTLSYSFKKFVTLGFAMSFESTGSRISLADYSGEYFFDTRIHAFSPGGVIEISNRSDKLRYSFCNEVGFESTRLSLIESIRVGSQSTEDAYSFKSRNLYYEAYLKATYPVLFLRIGVFAGYLLDIKKEPFSGKSMNGKNIELSGGQLAAADWSGIRLGLSVSVNLFHAEL